MGYRTREFLCVFRLPCKLQCHSGRMIQHTQWYLKVSVAEGDTFWSLWQPSISESYLRILEQRPTHLLREFLVCYWIFVKTEHFTVSHQVIMRSERLPRNGYCLTHAAIKLGMHGKTLFSNGSDIYATGPKQALEVQVSYMKCPKCHGSRFCYVAFSLLARTYALWGIPMTSWWGIEIDKKKI